MQNLQKNTITKGAIALGLSAILASSAIAEDDGAFVGLEVGLTSVKAEAKATAPAPMAVTNTAKDILPSLAIKGGYKWFFGDSKRFGTRAYGIVGVGTGSLTQLSTTFAQGGGNASFISGSRHTYYTTYIDYMVGADALFNFANSDSFTFGLFAGVGLGGTTWAANGKEFEPKGGTGKGRSYANFQVALNVGLRANIAKTHGIEVGGRFYLPDAEIFNAVGATTAQGQATTTTTHARPWAINLSYIFNF